MSQIEGYGVTTSFSKSFSKSKIVSFYRVRPISRVLGLTFQAIV